MKAQKLTHTQFAVLTLAALLFLGAVYPAHAQRRRRKTDPNAEPAWYIGLLTNSLPTPSLLTSIYDDDDFLGLTMDGLRSPGLKNKLQKDRKVEIDSTGQYISFTERVNDITFGIPRYMTMAQYIEQRRADYMRTAYSDFALNRLGQGYGNSSGGAIRIDIPVEIKSKAFQKVFGGSRVGLDVSGDINIKGGLRNEKRSQVKTSYTDGRNTNFKMEQTQRFNVSGHVGEKVTIEVDQDSEAAFDFDNNIRLDYKGYEDEIIQTIEAGNISMSLPGTRFVTASSKSAGLFGIKTTAKIGNLSLTAIASQEKGEKKKIKLTGGSTDEQKELKISNYKRGIYYFLDEYYRNRYEKRDGNGNFEVESDRRIVDIDVYISGSNYQTLYDDSVPGVAVAYDSTTIDKVEYIAEDPSNGSDSNIAHNGYFVLLQQTEYRLYEETGFIRLNKALQEGEVLAVAYKDAGGRSRGELEYTGAQIEAGDKIKLKMLKTKSPRSDNITWPLEFKNVYSIGNRNMNPDEFELSIFYDVPSGDDQETVELEDKKITWLEAFGLDKVDQTGAPNPDAIVDNHPNIINYAYGELMLPQLRPFDPDKDNFELLYNLLANSADKPLFAPALYDTTISTATTVINEQSKFYFKLKSSAKSDVYRLGTMIIENSEEVFLNGRQLVAHSDYELDYFSGQLTILNEEALGENANLEISYESQQLFTIDKKTMLGIRTEYDLWGDSFIGGTFMYLNESTLDQKVRVGKGPMRNMVWDFNTSLSAKPFFLTRAANFLPFVDTRQQSTIKFEGEIAQILPNPNTRNNDRTGDHDGVAYIDDFEASKRTTPLSTMRNAWSYCSPPDDAPYLDYGPDGYFDLTNRSRLIYQNPFTQYPINLIWPNRDIVGQTSKTVNIMIMDFFTSDSANGGRQACWNGIQTPLSAGMSNQSEAKYLEVWVKTGPLNVANGKWALDAGYQSTFAELHIDLGQISEDIIPNRKLDTEDVARNGIRNLLLDEGEDIGLDGMAGKDPEDFWDLNKNGKRDPGEPISWDDWKYDYQSYNAANFASYEQINGTENSENDGTRIPDTEDLNGNGDVDLFNDYFKYKITLAPDDPEFQKYLAGNSKDLSTGYDAGWKLFRIPLNDFYGKKGSPDLSLIESARIWITGATEEQLKISITELNLVGSDWKEQGIATLDYPENLTYTYSDTMTNETIIDETLTLSVVNTHDNPEYQPPKGVEGEIDKITQVQAKEQALVLNVNNMLPKYFGKVQKVFYDSQDYIHYKNMKMYIYGLDDYGTHITSDTSFVEYFLRFGADKYNYYEIKIPVFRGWTKNEIDINLIEMAQIKATVAGIDSLQSIFRIKNMPGGRKWIVRGEPSLTNIKMLEAGVINKHPREPFTGKIYMNELRLSNVQKDKGIAMRARLDFALADLISFNGEVNRRDADFHNVSERFGSGDNEFNYNLNTRVAVDKFLPRQLSISLPVNFNYSKSDNTPKYIPGKDIEITSDLPDSTIEAYKSVSESMGGSVNFGFKSKSQNFVMKYILLPFKANYSYKESESSNSTTKINKKQSQSGGLNWGISFGKNNFIRPLQWMGNSKLLTPLTEMKLYYTPNNFSTRINGNQNDNYSEKRRSGVISQSGSFKINRDVSSSMNITDGISLDVSRSFVNDMQDVPSDSIVTYFKNFDFGALTNINNNWGAKYNPKNLPLGLKFSANYTNAFRYSWNKQQTTQSKSTSQQNSITMTGGFTPSTFAKSIFGTGSSRKRSSNRSARNSRNSAKAAKPAEADKEKKEKKINIDIKKLLVSTISSVDPINLTYNTTDNQQLYGITGMPNYRFQFGLDRQLPNDLYEIFDEGTTSTNRNSRAQQWRKGVTTGIKITRQVSIQFKYDENWTKNSSSTTTGQRSKTWMYLNDGKFNDPFPTWTIRLSGLEKIPFLKNYVQTISLDHSRTGKWSESFAYKEGVREVTKETFETAFSPMVRMNFRMKNGLNMSMSYNSRQKQDNSNTTNSSATRTNSKDFSLTVSYTMQGNFKLPIPGLSSKRLKNKIDFAGQVTWSDNLTEKRKQADAPFEPTAKTKKLLVKPEIKYSFSSRVRGGLYFEMGYTDNMQIGKTSYKEFGLDVNISIRN